MPIDLIERADISESELEELKSLIPKWISVKNRLPEIDQKVLTYAKYFETNQDYLNKQSCWANADNQADVTHWMPLPAPPEDVKHFVPPNAYDLVMGKKEG